jgi:hypothetical protein
MTNENQTGSGSNILRRCGFSPFPSVSSTLKDMKRAIDSFWNEDFQHRFMNSKSEPIRTVKEFFTANLHPLTPEIQNAVDFINRE